MKSGDSSEGGRRALVFLIAFAGVGAITPVMGGTRGEPTGERGSYSRSVDVTALDRFLLQASNRGPEDVFQQQCAVCHGIGGEGDGPAAPALKPPPADLTDPERMGELTDDQLREVISQGRGSMPGFSAVLKPDQMEEMVRYVRSLSAGGYGAAPDPGASPGKSRFAHASLRRLP